MIKLEMDLAASMVELDLSGFVFDKHQMAFALDFENRQRNHEAKTDRTQEDDQFLG